MSHINLNPLAAGFCQCFKCSKLISEYKSYFQCNTCMQSIDSNCISRKKSNQQSSSNNVQFTCDSCSKCPVCSKKVAYNHKAILCDICNTWVHIKCNQLTIDDNEKFQNTLSHKNSSHKIFEISAWCGKFCPTKIVSVENFVQYFNSQAKIRQDYRNFGLVSKILSEEIFYPTKFCPKK